MRGTAFSISQQPISKIRLACALFVFIASLIVYARTLAPTVTLIDSGELIVAASSLGVAHPPGFPLYVLLAHLATRVPVGSVAVRVNFASALFAALAASVLSLVVVEVLMTVRVPRAIDRARKRANRKKTKKAGAPPLQTPNGPPRQSTFVLVVSCLMSGLLLAFSRTLWAYATIAEVYTLTALLILTVFLLMFRWRRGYIETTHRQNSASAQDEEVQSAPGPDATTATTNRSSRPISAPVTHRSLYAAAFVFGLALGVHHVSIGLMLPALAVLVFATAGIHFFRSKGLIYAALFAVAGLILIYAYLPLAASRSPIMNWGDPRTLERLWWQVTGRQYQVFFSYSLETAASQFSAFLKLAAREFGPWWLPGGAALALAGLVTAFRRDKAVFWFLALVIAADLLYALGYDIAEDKDAYYLPALIAMTIAAGLGAEWFIKKVTSAVGGESRRSIAGVLVLLVPIAALLGNWSYNNRSRYFIAQDYVHNILSTVEPGGMLLTRDWQVYSPMLYFQEIEHLRKDAVVIDVNQLRRSWYFDYLRKAYPATMEQSAKQVDAFLEDLRQWEQDPDLYQRDLMLNQRINSRFYDMILVFVSNHVQMAPVYVALDIAGNREGQDAELTKSLAARYEFIPQGLLFQLAAERSLPSTGEPQLLTRGLADGTVEFADDDVVTQKVLPVYVNMLYNRGRYLALHGRHEQAIAAFKQSLILNPRFTLAQQAINESLNALRTGAAPGSQ
jgi:tetratricopeptide (TPR) repeat protein